MRVDPEKGEEVVTRIAGGGRGDFPNQHMLLRNAENKHKIKIRLTQKRNPSGPQKWQSHLSLRKVNHNLFRGGIRVNRWNACLLLPWLSWISLHAQTLRCLAYELLWEAKFNTWLRFHSLREKTTTTTKNDSLLPEIEKSLTHSHLLC